MDLGYSPILIHLDYFQQQTRQHFIKKRSRSKLDFCPLFGHLQNKHRLRWETVSQSTTQH